MFHHSSVSSMIENPRLSFGIENRRTSSGPNAFSSYGQFAIDNPNATIQTPRPDEVDPSAIAAAEAAAAIVDHHGNQA